MASADPDHTAEPRVNRPHQDLCAGGLCFASDETDDCTCWCHLAPDAPVPNVDPTRHVTTYTEWRVTGQPVTPAGFVDAFPPYVHVISGCNHPDAEGFARRLIASVAWDASGVRLERREVTVTPWVDADAPASVVAPGPGGHDDASPEVCCAVAWSDEDEAYVATCSRHPSLSWIADSEHEALLGLGQLLDEVRRDRATAPGEGDN